VAPAGFTGVLELTLTPPPSGQSELVAAIDPPLFNPDLDPQDVNGFVQGAQAYARENLGITIPPELVPNLEQYLKTQLRNVVTNGREALVASAGSQIQVYSLAQLKIDLALFGVVRTVTASSNPLNIQKAYSLLSSIHQVLASLFFGFQLGPNEAMAQGVSVPPQPNGCPPPPPCGAILPPGCSCRNKDDVGPPPIPPAPGCDPKDPSTYGNCQLTKDHCETLPNHKVVKKGDGLFCVPNKKPKNCPEIPIPNPHLGAGNADCGEFPIRETTSLDPNDKVGTLGATEAQFLFNGLPLHYTIHFENLETASAPAQEVVITDQLDINTVDLDTFSLGSISFGDIRVTPAPGVSQYIGGVDLRPEQNLIVQIKAGLDKNTGIVTWRFTSADPTTLQLTDDPLAGFLSPNVNPPEGEGRVLFSVMPKKNLSTGATICNRASIVFDVNEPIDTPQWCNTIDQTPPTSKVSALAATQTVTSFPVQWSGMDEGAGMGDYTLWASVDGGPYNAVVTTTDTATVFTGEVGKQYAFYTIARDLVGNEEAPPQVADATTRIAGEEQCPQDPQKTSPGLCGCGVADTDSDGDGTPDCQEQCPSDATKTSPGACGCGTAESVVGQACTTGLLGVCSAGTKVCTGGVVSCQQSQQPAAESCDGLDNNCNGQVDEGLTVDADQDGFTAPGSCTGSKNDCNDANAAIHPGAPELCGDGVDQDCDGRDRPCESTGGTLFLHATTTTLVLTSTAPTGTSAKSQESPRVNFAHGNPWKEVGVWTASPGHVSTLSALGTLRLWLGLKTSDDVGTQFDVKAEVRKGGVVVATGEARCVRGVTLNPRQATEVAVPFGAFSPVAFGAAPLSVRLLTRIGTTGEGGKCSGPGGSHTSAQGLRVYFAAITRPAGVRVTP
jgi:hypothetical protein